MGAKLASVLALARRGRDHGDVRAKRSAELHAHVAEAAETDDRHLCLRSNVVLPKRRIGGDPRAKQRSDAAEVHAFRHLQAEMVAHDDMVGVAALGDRVVVIVRAIVGLDAALAAEDFPAFQALVALHAAVDHAAYGHGVADAVTRDLVADCSHRADDLMAGNDRIARSSPVVAAGVEVAVADPRVSDLDGDIVRAQGAAFELHGTKRLIRRVRAPTLRGGRSGARLCGWFNDRRHFHSPIVRRSSTRLACTKCGRSTILPPTDRTPASGSCLECGDDFLRMPDFVVGRRERGVDDRRLAPGGWRVCR